jgi:hypothetical protein
MTRPGPRPSDGCRFFNPLALEKLLDDGLSKSTGAELDDDESLSRPSIARSPLKGGMATSVPASHQYMAASAFVMQCAAMETRKAMAQNRAFLPNLRHIHDSLLRCQRHPGYRSETGSAHNRNAIYNLKNSRGEVLLAYSTEWKVAECALGDMGVLNFEKVAGRTSQCSIPQYRI